MKASVSAFTLTQHRTNLSKLIPEGARLSGPVGIAPVHGLNTCGFVSYPVTTWVSGLCARTRLTVFLT
jgi:hypothetical protein